jgi:serine protease SohB
MKDLYGDKVKLVAYGQRRSLLQRFGSQITGSALSEVEDRALWARFGL